jgi:signal transduction histidine kinase
MSLQSGVEDADHEAVGRKQPPAGSGRLRSSMESFLDEYQLVRLWISAAGLVPVSAFLILGRSVDLAAPIGVVLLVVAGHASWCRARHIRSPKTMLLLDVTLWGWVMTLMPNVVVPTATLAFLALLVILFGEGYWIALFLTYLAGWYGYAYFAGTPLDFDSGVAFAGVLMTVGGLAVVVSHVRRWLGRLDANRSQMLGTVSHELRNNLTGMIGITDLMSEDLEIDPVEMKDLMVLANQQAVEASEIVEDLLTISRLEGSVLTVESVPVDVASEVATVVSRFAGEGTDVSIEGAEVTRPARGDALRVRQILRNLVSNAVRYGGPHIAITTTESDGHITITVSDDGDGVRPEDVDSIFLAYRRSTSTRRDAASVGLGLWICRQLAVAMRGTIAYQRVESCTRFVLQLPVYVESVDGQELAAAPRRPMSALSTHRDSLSSAVSI